MNAVTTTSAASISTGIYEDPIDRAFRFYGVPGQAFGPLNLKYQSSDHDQSLVTKIVRLGVERQVAQHFFGMELQLDSPMTVTELGQFDPGNNPGQFEFTSNHSIYTLSLVRAEDGAVLATADLDMGNSKPDAMGFKYVRLTQPIRLEASAKRPVIYPRGLLPGEIYEVRSSNSGLRLRQTGAKLMSEGISLEITAGELIFLNLPHYPGSRTDQVPPSSPTQVTKRLGANLGVQGVELSWSAAQDNNWISYYEIRKNGKVIGKTAKGTFFFDHSDSARNDINTIFDVRAVDGDGNRSPAVTAQPAASGPQVFEALGDFSPTQSAKSWIYEEALVDNSYRNLVWDKGGYEGRWTGSGLGRIGRIWMQSSAQYDLSRTFVVPVAGVASTSGVIRKDPSAENHASCFVRILRNSAQVWPPEGWAEVGPNYDAPTSYDVTNLRVSPGDKLRFMVKHNQQNRLDPIVWDPKVTIQGPDAAKETSTTSR